MKPIYIYALQDPRDNLVKYVGKTTNLYQRFCDHLCKRPEDSKRTRWLKEITSVGLRPEMFVLEEVNSSNWMDDEKFWVEYLKSIGCPLLNSNKGGRGESPDQETRLKMRMAQLGKKKGAMSEEHKAKISKANRGQRISDENKQKVSMAMRAYHERKRVEKLGAMLVICLLMICSGCAVTPNVTERETIPYSGNSETGGILSFLPDGSIEITESKRAEYNTLIKKYGTMYVPEVQKDHEITKLENGNYALTGEGAETFKQLLNFHEYQKRLERSHNL